MSSERIETHTGLYFLFWEVTLMRYNVVTQVKVINGSTPEETAVLFNEAMHQPKGQNPAFERDGNRFGIFYTAGE